MAFFKAAQVAAQSKEAQAASQKSPALTPPNGAPKPAPNSSNDNRDLQMQNSEARKKTGPGDKLMGILNTLGRYDKESKESSPPSSQHQDGGVRSAAGNVLKSVMGLLKALAAIGKVSPDATKPEEGHKKLHGPKPGGSSEC